MTTRRALSAAARRLADVLRACNVRVVFAESCTGGLVSAALTGVPGVSEFLCGSAVVYRIETKAEWLGVSREMLKKPGPVSRAVAAEMAAAVLSRTPEAHIAASVTGHLGPWAPARQDGLVYIGLTTRETAGNGRGDEIVRRHRLAQATADAGQAQRRLRERRQREAAVLVLDAVTDYLTELRCSGIA